MGCDAGGMSFSLSWGVPQVAKPTPILMGWERSQVEGQYHQSVAYPLFRTSIECDRLV